MPDYLLPYEAEYERQAALEDARDRAYESRFEELLEDVLEDEDWTPFLEREEIWNGVAKFLEGFQPFRDLIWEQAVAQVERNREEGPDDFDDF